MLNEYQHPHVTLWLFVTNNCNRHCGYCKQTHTVDRTDNMSEDSLRYILDTCAKMYENKTVGNFLIQLAGGEPMLNFKMFKDIVPYYLDKFPHIFSFCMATNGTIVDDEIVWWFKRHMPRLCLSLDSLRFSKPFKNESSANLQLQNIEKLKRAGVTVSSITVLSTQTAEELLELAEWAVANLSSWQINIQKPIVHSKKHLVSVLKPVISYLFKKQYFVRDASYPRFRIDGWNLWAKSGIGGCPCGRSLFAVYPDLEVTPSCDFRSHLGKFNEDIQSFIEHPNNIVFKENRRPEFCNECKSQQPPPKVVA